MIYLMLFGMFGGMAEAIPYVSVIIFIALAAWVYAVIKLGKIVDKVISGGSDVHLTIEEEEIISEEHRRKRDMEGAVPQVN